MSGGDGMGESRLIVVGLDSASPKLVSKWGSQLPNISSIIKDGVSGVLWSSHPPMTIPAWNCFSTGKNPGKIGVYDFLNLMGDGSTRVYDSTMQDSPDVWEIIGAHGKRVGVYNVPTTYPPRRVNGFLVSGKFAPSSSRDYAYPKELVKELDRLTGHYELDILPMDYEHYVKGGKEALFEEIQRLHRQQETVTLHLMKKFRWDFFMVVFTLLDEVQHHFYDERDPFEMDVILQSYKLADETLGSILKDTDEDTSVLIASDHGAGQAPSVFFVNGWLKRQGYLEFARRPESPSLSEVVLPMAGRIVQRHFRPTTISALLRGLPFRLQIYEAYARSLKRSADSRLDLRDWTRTRAFSLGSSCPCGRIYLNRQHPHRGDCELLKTELKSKIPQISESLGLAQAGNVFVDIMDREKVYWGKYAHLAPDLIFYIYVNGKVCDISAGFCDQLWGLPGFGSHEPDGFWALRGQNICRGRVLDAKITDMAPTILHVLGIPIPTDMDGTVVKEAFVNWTSTLEPPMSGPKQEFAYTPEEQEEILGRLHRLGYV
jgi:predicted AlkP superfamily phosphohydrolase/phosphomutase